MDTQDRIKLAASTLLIAALAHLASCGIGRATPHEVRYRNTDATRSVGVLRVCQGAACTEVPSICAAGVTCSVVIDLSPGTSATTALVAEQADGPWSDPSNALSITVPTHEQWCLSVDACRFDVDGSHSVTVADFGRFFRALGSSW